MENARNAHVTQLIEDTLPLVKHVVYQVAVRFPHHVDRDELARAGVLGLVQAAHRYDDTTKCILCAACTTSCPIFWGDEEYVGPAAIVNAHRFVYDSRDEGSRRRLEILAEKNGVFRCRTTFNCTESCPRGIQVTQAIQEVKRALMFAR